MLTPEQWENLRENGGPISKGELFVMDDDPCEPYEHMGDYVVFLALRDIPDIYEVIASGIAALSENGNWPKAPTLNDYRLAMNASGAAAELDPKCFHTSDVDRKKEHRC